MEYPSGIIEGRESVSGQKLMRNFVDESLLIVPEVDEVTQMYGRILEYFPEGTLDNAKVLKDPLEKENFNERLREFLDFIDVECLRLEKNLVGIWRNQFSENWKSNIKKACIHAFFVHYGAKRKGEKDKKNQPRDYVYHVVRAAFNCLLRKSRFFDEKALLATILHDSREDLHKGLMGAVYLGENFRAGAKEITKTDFAPGGTVNTLVANGLRQEIELDLERSLSNSAPQKKYPDDLTITDLVDILSKESSNRNTAFLLMLDKFFKICEERWEQIKQNKGFDDYKKFIFRNFVRVFKIKASDRLDNIKSLASNGTIIDETEYFFITPSVRFGAYNVLDFFEDYLSAKEFYLKDRELGKLRDLAQGVGSDQDFPEKNLLLDRLRSDFTNKLNCELQKLGIRNFEMNSDFVFEFRQIGKRFDREWREGLNPSTLTEYGRSLLHFLIVYPLVEDANEKETFRRIANEVLREIFSGSRGELPDGSDPYRADEIVNTPLFKIIAKERVTRDQELTGFKGVANNFQPQNAENNFSFGACEWRVFGSQFEAVNALLGQMDVGFFYMDQKISGLETQTLEIAEYLLRLKADIEDWKKINPGDIFKPLDSVRTEIANAVERVLVGSGGSNLPLLESIDAIMKNNSYTCSSLMAITFFHRKFLNKSKVTISIFGQESKSFDLRLFKSFSPSVIVALLEPKILAFENVKVRIGSVEVGMKDFLNSPLSKYAEGDGGDTIPDVEIIVNPNAYANLDLLKERLAEIFKTAKAVKFKVLDGGADT